MEEVELTLVVEKALEALSNTSNTFHTDKSDREYVRELIQKVVAEGRDASNSSLVHVIRGMATASNMILQIRMGTNSLLDDKQR